MSSSRRVISAEMNKIFTNSVKNYLEVNKFNFDLVYGFDPKSNRNNLKQINEIKNNMVHAVMLKDKDGMLMAVFPASHILDLNVLNKSLEREFTPVFFHELKSMLFGCNTGICPPLPDIYGTDAVFDHSFEYMDDNYIYFSSGMKNEYIKIKLSDFKKLHSKVNYEIFSEAVSNLHYPWETKKLNNEGGVLRSFVDKRMEGRIRDIKEFPAVPVLAEAVLQMRVDEQASGAELASIIERDPSLSAQVMAWANSSFYGYKGEINSVEEAIVKVLGFDLVMNLCLCVAVGRNMHIPLHGPIGLKNTWKLAVYTSVVVDSIVKIMPKEKNIKPGLAFLGALLHNFGYMLLGQTFTRQFELLNHMLACNYHVESPKIELYTLGVGHEMLGKWLLEEWKLPSEVIAGVEGHHRPDFEHKHSIYAKIILVAIRLLKRHNLGDEKTVELPKEILDELGVEEEELTQIVNTVISKKDDLDDLINCILR